MADLWKRASPTRSAYEHDLRRGDPIKRARAWRDLMRERSVTLVGNPDPETLRGSIKGQAFDGGVLARWTLSRQVLTQAEELRRAVGDEYVFIGMTIAGHGVHDWDGETSAVGVGDFTITDATRDFTNATTSDMAAKGFFHIKKSALRERIGSRHEAAFGIYKAGSPLQRLAFGFLRDLTGLVGQVDTETLTMLAGQALDVVSLCINERGIGAIEDTTHRSAMLLRLKAHIKANLRDPTYTLADAAAAMGVTPRYVNALLARAGTSFGRYLLECRLVCARRDIVDPRNVHRQVTEIGFDWGFNNASHFGKVFKERFGMTPRDTKMAGAMAAVRAVA